MRPVVYSLTASLDGYINRADGSLDWINTDFGMPAEEFFASSFKRFDAVIIGRKTYETMLGPSGPSLYPGMANYVVSGTLPPGVHDGAEFVSGDLSAWANKLRSQQGKDIWLSGGGELARSFLKLGLVDEISLTIQPILLGKGVPLFPGPFPQSKLKLERSHAFESGLIELTYRVLR